MEREEIYDPVVSTTSFLKRRVVTVPLGESEETYVKVKLLIGLRRPCELRPMAYNPVTRCVGNLSPG